MARVFSAVDIEDEELLDELEQVRDTVNLGFNPVKREKMHVTLEFFSDIDEDGIEEVKNAMKELSLDPFSAKIEGLGAFPSQDYIRVVWAGVEAEEFHRLHRAVSDHGVESSNDHAFKPHITLARVRDVSPGKKKKLQRSLREFSNHGFGTMDVNRVKLFESLHTGNGTTYRELHSEEL